MREIKTETIKAAAAGDRKAFKELYEHYREYLWVVVYRTVHGNRDEADEVFQKLFIRVFEKLRTFKFNSALSTWLYKMAWRVLMDHFRAKNRFWKRFLSFDETTHSVEEKSYTDEVDVVLAMLNPEERYLLIAKEVEGLSFDELAEITGKKSGALRTMFHRMKERLREEAQNEV